MQQPRDTPKNSGNLPAFAGIGAASLLTGATTYTIAKGQADVKHNDHAAQAGGEFTQGREQHGSTAAGGLDASKADLPGDAPNKPENLAVSEEKMQEKAPSKRVDPQE
ncbi:hypothetical protein Daus18300_012626 [Diaporthe australafricana]|uniref:Uncharacterized protein n=1 Tax=Diaporthe australafricana TaxID=127596 RepID=A0ABR3W210_9PEZI